MGLRLCAICGETANVSFFRRAGARVSWVVKETASSVQNAEQFTTMRNTFRLCTLLFYISLSAPCGRAQGLDPAKSISQYSHQVWQTKDGLPQNSVNAIIQDRSGYLWLGTQEGLVRFDGVRFYVVDKKHVPDLESNYVWAIAEGSDSSLWIGTRGGGLLHLKGGKSRAYTTRDGLPSDIVVSLAFDSHDNLWIGTHEGGLTCFTAGDFRTYSTAEGLPSNTAQVLLRDSKERIWIGTGGGGLSCMVDGALSTFNRKQGLGSDIVTALHETRQGLLLIGTTDGVRVMKDGRITPFTVAGRKLAEVVLSIQEDRNGAIWFGMAGGGLVRVWKDRVDRFGTKEGLSDGLVRALFEDREGNLWIGTYGGGLNRFSEARFDSYTRSEGLSHDFILSICEDGQGAMWIGTYEGGLNRLKNGSITQVTTRDGLPMNTITSVCSDRSGAIWIGTNGKGLARLKEGRVTSYASPNDQNDHAVLCMLQDSRGQVWIGSNKGLSRWTGEFLETVNVFGDLPLSPVVALAESRAGHLWIGTDGGGLVRLKNGERTLLTRRDGLANDFVISLYEDGEGSLWIGTDGGGLCRYRDGKFVTIDSRRGLFDDVVFSILEDSSGNFWMSCNKGIFRVAKKDLDDVAEERSKSIVCASFGKADGMPSNECVGRRQPSAWKGKDGRLWFSTIKGVVVIDPKKMRTNTQPPPVLIEALVAEGSFVRTSNIVTVPPRYDRFEIRYTALSFVASEKVEFQYCLEGFDARWITAGSRRIAYYTNVPSGTYTFRLRAGNNDGVWNTEGASMIVTVEPYFYRTWYFYVGLALLFGLFGAAAYRTRMIGHRKRELELVTLVDERTRDLRQEITEKKRVEEALRLSEQRFRDIIEHSTNLFYVHDTNHVLTYVSPQTRQFFDCEPEEALVRWIDFVTDNPMNELGVGHTERAIQTGQTQPVYELELIGKMGRVVRVEVHETPIVREGKTVAIVGALTDVTEKRRLEDQLRQGQKLQSLGILAGGIAHNFNNILGIILAYASMLRRDREDQSRFANGVDAIQNSVERGAALVRQLLTFARKTDTQLETLDVNTTVRELAKMISETFPKTISFVYRLEEGVPMILTDHNQLHQVLLNLCVNARDAMSGEGTLTIMTKKVYAHEVRRRFANVADTTYAMISVADNGMGMDESVRNRIFEPFFTTKEVGKGTGLGLSVVYGIVESQGGLIDVQSEIGKGTVFSVFLPVTLEGIIEDRRTEQSVEEMPGGSETILVVEDEELLLNLLTSLLERKGYTVLAAADGLTAVDLFNNRPNEIHLVLMDVGLPHMSGWESLKSMRRIDPTVKVILASGYLESDVQERSLQEGADAFLAKPYVPEKVHSMVRRVLDKPKSAPARL